MADLETVAQRRLRLSATRHDLHLAQIVAQRLSQPGDVTIDFCGELVLGEGHVGCLVREETQHIVE